MQHLNLHLVQADLVWENAEANLRHLGHLIQDLPAESLVVLPEMFATGFTMNPEKNAQDMDGAAVQWMCKMSEEKKFALCGSLAITENDLHYNRFIWVQDGRVKYIYDKRHLFTFGSEPRHYESGDHRIHIEYRGWKILPFVCYDLRFPVWCRNTENAELMLFVANWPQSRIKAWQKLLQARAIENQCFVAGVNRVGEDGNNIYHDGSSMICDPRGEVLQMLQDNEGIISMQLSSDELHEFRSHFPVLNDRDEFEIQ